MGSRLRSVAGAWFFVMDGAEGGWSQRDGAATTDRSAFTIRGSAPGPEAGWEQAAAADA